MSQLHIIQDPIDSNLDRDRQMNMSAGQANQLESITESSGFESSSAQSQYIQMQSSLPQISQQQMLSHLQFQQIQAKMAQQHYMNQVNQQQQIQQNPQPAGYPQTQPQQQYVQLQMQQIPQQNFKFQQQQPNSQIHPNGISQNQQHQLTPQQQQTLDQFQQQQQPQQPQLQQTTYGANSYQHQQQNTNNQQYTQKYYKDFVQNLYMEEGEGEISIYRSQFSQYVMVTCIDISTLYKDKRGKALELIQNLSNLKHDNLIQIFKWWYIPDQTIFIETEAPHMYFQQQNQFFNDQSTNDHQRVWKTFSKNKFEDDELLEILKRLASAINVLHQMNMVHRDVHPSRFQLYLDNSQQSKNTPLQYQWQYSSDRTKRFNVKFNSIGMPFNFKKLLKRDNFSGHVNYSAPELILDNMNFSTKVDVWSFGCCIYYFLTKKDPFEGKNPKETKFNILNQQFDKFTLIYHFKERLPNSCIKNLLARCLNHYDNRRPDFQQIINIIQKHQNHIQYQSSIQGSQMQQFQQQQQVQHQVPPIPHLQPKPQIYAEQMAPSNNTNYQRIVIDQDQIQQPNQQNVLQQQQQEPMQIQPQVPPAQTLPFSFQQQQQIIQKLAELETIQQAAQSEVLPPSVKYPNNFTAPMQQNFLDINAKQFDFKMPLTIAKVQHDKIPVIEGMFASQNSKTDESKKNNDTIQEVEKQSSKETDEKLSVLITNDLTFQKNKSTSEEHKTESLESPQKNEETDKLQARLKFKGASQHPVSLQQPLSQPEYYKNQYLQGNTNKNSEEIFGELEHMPQKMNQSVLSETNPIAIKEQADRVNEMSDLFTKAEKEIIEQNQFASYLIPAIKKPTEFQDLKLVGEADQKDLQDWIETANEMFPTIQEDENQALHKVEMDHDRTQLNCDSALFNSQKSQQNLHANINNFSNDKMNLSSRSICSQNVFNDNRQAGLSNLLDHSYLGKLSSDHNSFTAKVQQESDTSSHKTLKTITESSNSELKETHQHHSLFSNDIIFQNKEQSNKNEDSSQNQNDQGSNQDGNNMNQSPNNNQLNQLNEKINKITKERRNQFKSDIQKKDVRQNNHLRSQSPTFKFSLRRARARNNSLGFSHSKNLTQGGGSIFSNLNQLNAGNLNLGRVNKNNELLISSQRTLKIQEFAHSEAENNLQINSINKSHMSNDLPQINNGPQQIEKKDLEENKVSSIGPNNADKVVSNEQHSFEVISGGVIGQNPTRKTQSFKCLSIQNNSFDNRLGNNKVLHDNNGSIYEGELNSEGFKHGVGQLLDSSGNMFEGTWNQGALEGVCKIKYNSGDVYEGQFQNDKEHGIGVKQFIQSNERYEGQWINGKMTGMGKYFFNTDDNKVYTGQFYQGDLYGKGVITTNQYIYRGMVKNGLFDGFGRYEDIETHVVYEGSFKEGKRDGFGKESDNEPGFHLSEYEGFWQTDLKHGDGKIKKQKSHNDQILYIEGVWVKNQLTKVISNITGSKEEIEGINKNTNRFGQMMKQIKNDQVELQDQMTDQVKWQDEIEDQIIRLTKLHLESDKKIIDFQQEEYEMKKMQSQDPNKTFILYDRDAFNEAMMSMNEDEIELDVSAVIDGE